MCMTSTCCLSRSFQNKFAVTVRIGAFTPGERLIGQDHVELQDERAPWKTEHCFVRFALKYLRLFLPVMFSQSAFNRRVR